MPFFTHRGLDYHYAQWGDPDGVPLVLLHGFAQSGETWSEIAPYLAQDRLVIAFDLVGHGLSARPHDRQAYEISAMCETLDTLCGRLGLDKIDLVGYSAGGRMALTYALSRATRIHALVLESAGLGWTSQEEYAELCKRDAIWEESLRTGGIEAFMNYWESLPLFATQKKLSESKRNQIRERRLNNSAEALALVIQGSGQHAMRDSRSSLATLSLPVLYIAGTKDAKYSQIAQSLEGMEGVEVALLATGHDVHTEDTKAYLATLKDFLLRASQGLL